MQTPSAAGSFPVSLTGRFIARNVPENLPATSHRRESGIHLMRRSALLIVLVLAATSMLVSCGSGPPAAPTSSAQTPLVGQKFTLSGDIGDENVRPVELQ